MPGRPLPVSAPPAARRPPPAARRPPPAVRARAWLAQVYGPVVELAVPEAVAQTPRALLFALPVVAQPGSPATPGLNATLVVPKDGARSFHPANADPWGDVKAVHLIRYR